MFVGVLCCGLLFSRFTWLFCCVLLFSWMCFDLFCGLYLLPVVVNFGVFVVVCVCFTFWLIDLIFVVFVCVVFVALLFGVC